MHPLIKWEAEKHSDVDVGVALVYSVLFRNLTCWVKTCVFAKENTPIMVDMILHYVHTFNLVLGSNECSKSYK